jgi:hypothetical protein
MKYCRKCATLKPLTEFTRHRGAKSSPDKIRATCKSCCREYERANAQHIRERRRLHRAKPGIREREAELRRLRHEADPAKRTAEWRKRNYGLTPQTFGVLLGQQEGCCAICAKILTATHTDHDHKTGAVRGLLCPGCNRGLGAFRDSPSAMRAAADYIVRTSRPL